MKDSDSRGASESSFFTRYARLKRETPTRNTFFFVFINFVIIGYVIFKHQKLK